MMQQYQIFKATNVVKKYTIWELTWLTVLAYSKINVNYEY